MSNTLSAMRQTLRGLLADQVAPFQWTDAALNQAIWEAVAAHSNQFPHRVVVAYTLSAGTTSLPLYAVDTLAPGATQAGVAPAIASDLLGVIRVELPAYTTVIEDPLWTAPPELVGATTYTQAWRYVDGYLFLRNPASGNEVGAGTLRVEELQTWSRPDTGDQVAWNGPIHDEQLVYLYAMRAAYRILAGWQVRDMAGKTVAQVPVAPVLDWLDSQIAEATLLRRKQSSGSRTMDRG